MGHSRHMDSLVPRSDGSRKVSLEGGQVVDWSRWCGREGSWQASLLDRAGFPREERTIKIHKEGYQISFRCLQMQSFCKILWGGCSWSPTLPSCPRFCGEQGEASSGEVCRTSQCPPFSYPVSFPGSPGRRMLQDKHGWENWPLQRCSVALSF